MASLNGVIAMQQGVSTDRTDWCPLDDAYPHVISHRLFPIALLAEPRDRGHWVHMIAQELELRENIVEKIVDIEAGR